MTCRRDINLATNLANANINKLYASMLFVKIYGASSDWTFYAWFFKFCGMPGLASGRLRESVQAKRRGKAICSRRFRFSREVCVDLVLERTEFAPFHLLLGSNAFASQIPTPWAVLVFAADSVVLLTCASSE